MLAKQRRASAFKTKEIARAEAQRWEGSQTLPGSDERTPRWLGLQSQDTTHMRLERIGRETKGHIMMSLENHNLLRIELQDFIN